MSGERVRGDQDWLVCLCGNEPDRDGFYAVEGDREVEPDESWNGRDYVCLSCLRVIDVESLTVSRRLESVTLLDGTVLEGDA